MLTVKNLTRSDVSVDTLCLLLAPGESLDFMLTLGELRSLHPDLAELLDRGYLGVMGPPAPLPTAAPPPPPEDPEPVLAKSDEPTPVVEDPPAAEEQEAESDKEE